MKALTLTLFALLISTFTMAAETISSSTALFGAHLQASILIEPATSPPSEAPPKIQPGSTIKLAVKVKNIGDKANHSGDIFVRFAFLKPLEGEARSVLFETEKAHLPPLAPGAEIEIHFTKIHQWPSVIDYVRDDWHMRQYEAVVNIQGRSEVIGRTAVSVSAKYYNGPSHEIPVQVPEAH